MSLHDELLEQAERLARSETPPLSQADLRRAVSSAYYALFHLLAWEFASLYVKGPGLIAPIIRTLNHVEMKKTSERFIVDEPSESVGPTRRRLPTLPKALVDPPLPEDDPVWTSLSRVARTFVDLQRLRNNADYNLAMSFERHEVLRHVQSAREAFEHWDRVRDSDGARIFLACLQHWKTWDAPRD